MEVLWEGADAASVGNQEGPCTRYTDGDDGDKEKE